MRANVFKVTFRGHLAVKKRILIKNIFGLRLLTFVKLSRLFSICLNFNLRFIFEQVFKIKGEWNENKIGTNIMIFSMQFMKTCLSFRFLKAFLKRLDPAAFRERCGGSVLVWFPPGLARPSWLAGMQLACIWPASIRLAGILYNRHY